MANGRLRRATDLFVEGAEAYLGLDENSQPVVVWVNKLNAFEVDEARKDGLARRGAYIADLKKDDNGQHMGQLAAIAEWDDERLASELVEFDDSVRYLRAIDDIRADEEWREILDRNERLPELLDDEGVPDDDPRRQEIADGYMAYQEELRKRQQDSRDTALEVLDGVSRQELEKRFMSAWRDRMSVSVFMDEERISQIFFALRDCQAAVTENEDGSRSYDHAKCNHRVRLLQERAEVRTFPDSMMAKLVETLDDQSMGARAAGNSDAPASSSASSELSSRPEETSAASSPMETLPEPVTT